MMGCTNKVDPLAQSVEHNTFNVGVLGSSPKRITEKRGQMTSLFVFTPYLSAPHHLRVQALGAYSPEM